MGMSLRKKMATCHPLTRKAVTKIRNTFLKKLGKMFSKNAWNGFHTCLFAYGQTGSGKSYSMIGFGANRGIVPLACVDIFEKIAANTDPKKRYEVVCLICEIYNEKVQDLMKTARNRPRSGLKVRESRSLGVFVQGLTKNAVSTYEEIKKIMDIGEKNRSRGATLMNSESSRAHTVIQIQFK